MDVIQDWAAQLIGNHPNLQTYSPYARQLYSLLSTARSYLLPLINRVSQNPDLATIALLLLILFISLKILNILWQTVLFWLRLARKIVVWGGLAALALWMYTRGPEGAREDFEKWMGVWKGEYEFWRERERMARLGGRGGGDVRGGWY